MRREVEMDEGGNGGEVMAFCAIAAMVVAVAMCLAGCATKTRSVDLNGMYLSDTGTLAIGSVEVQAAPQGEETAAIRYSEDTAWLSPSTKTHDIRILLTGTNSVASAKSIAREICRAFTAVAATNAAPCRCTISAPARASATNETTTTKTTVLDV